MKKVFFKILELPTHQVLLHKDWDDYDDDEFSRPVIIMSFFLDGIKASYKLGYDTMKKRDDDFELFDESKAQKILDSTIVQFAGVEN